MKTRVLVFGFVGSIVVLVLGPEFLQKRNPLTIQSDSQEQL
jgi:hypothetical protein